MSPRYRIEDLAEKYRGRAIVIVGNGPTSQGNCSDFSDPIWTVNGGWDRGPDSRLGHVPSELGWCMDDIHGPALRHVSHTDEPDPDYPNMLASIRNAPIPIVTSCAYPGYPALVEFPLAEIARYYRLDLKRPYFDETINYMVAWAIMIGVVKIALIGVDYINVRPSERASLEFWLGFASGRGIQISISRYSHTLKSQELDGMNRHLPGLYGYLPESMPIPYTVKPDGGIRLQIPN